MQRQKHNSIPLCTLLLELCSRPPRAQEEMGPTASNAAEIGLGQHTPTCMAGRACPASQASTSTSCILGRARLHRAVSMSCLPRACPACPVLRQSTSCSAQDLALPWPPLAPRSARHAVLVLALLAGTVHWHPSPYHPCVAEGSAAPGPPTQQQAALTAQRQEQQCRREERKKT